jgi:spore coat protein CotF
MNPIIENLTGMNVLSDQVVAMDLLISAKSGVRNYAMAVTETGTFEIKEMLTRHLIELLICMKKFPHIWQKKDGTMLGIQTNQFRLK